MYNPVYIAITHTVGHTIHITQKLPLASWIGWLETGVAFLAN